MGQAPIHESRNASPFHYPAPWDGVVWGPSRPVVTPLITTALRLVRDALWVLVVGTVLVAGVTIFARAGL
ncbi:hypothetical protein [Brevundimonas sp. BAL3]|uniref:hypothetical protein n=1 Tax=Brevundimonas sp. BAL3 TaxID=391600 RepID=UPI0005906ACF|nr:hypothetical protein [Brevundimonas sp. BAL3]